MVNQDDCKQPPLLRTCRQIREEASAMFYAENEFEHRIDDLALAPQVQHWLWKHTRPTWVLNYGDASWSGLKKWFKLVHQCKIEFETFKIVNDDDDVLSEIVSDVFNMMEMMRDTPWDTTEYVLAVLRSSMIQARELDDNLWVDHAQDVLK